MIIITIIKVLIKILIIKIKIAVEMTINIKNYKNTNKAKLIAVYIDIDRLVDRLVKKNYIYS